MRLLWLLSQVTAAQRQSS